MLLSSFIITVFFASSVAWSNENKEIKISSRNRALTKLKLPGVKINLDEWSVDVDAEVVFMTVCWSSFFVLTTKEHESAS